MKNKIIRYSFGIVIGIIAFFILIIGSINLYFFVVEKTPNKNDKDIVLTLSGVVETKNQENSKAIKEDISYINSSQINNSDNKEKTESEFKIEIEPISKLFNEKIYVISGDALDIEYNIKNIKNISADIEEKISIVITDKNNNPISFNSKNPELQLYSYNDVIINKNGYFIKENAKLLGTIENNKIEYIFDTYYLNGAEENTQISDFKNSKMVLIFDKKAGNNFQSINILINIDVCGKYTTK